MGTIDWRTGPCSIGRAASVLGDRWSLLIMRNALMGQTRFDQFKKSLGIADNILSNRLTRLVEDGMLVREDYEDGARTRQHYRLTRAGADLRLVMESLAVWGQANTRPEAPTGAMEVIHRACGTVLTDGRYCPTCALELETSDVDWMMPWLTGQPRPLAVPVVNDPAA